ATDLISDSVAENLADTVTSESATLDQLRTFLNRSKSDGEASASSGDVSNSGSGLDLKNFFNGRDTTTSDSADGFSRTDGSDRPEPSAIPFPSDAGPSARSSGAVRLSRDTS
ncbi:MAG: hypothetical protein ACK56I_34460, partial [bacterium]